MIDEPTFPDDLNLADHFLFDRLAEGLADTPAILFGARRDTYAATAQRVRELQRYLGAAGIRREERVLTILHDVPAFAWSFFATLHHGAVVAMGNPDAPADDLAYLVRYTRATAVVTNPRVATALADTLREEGVRAVVLVVEVATGEDCSLDPVVPDALADLGAVGIGTALARGREHLHRAEHAPRPTRRDDPAIWLFTSGSTGRSKAAIHAHGDFAFNTEVYAKRTVGYRRGDVTVSVPRLFFGYATGTNLMFPFAVGATTALYAERPTPEHLASAIERHRPTIVTNVPTMMAKLLDADDARRERGDRPLDLSSVRFSLSAGEALPEALYDRFRERFGGDVYDGIGSAEMFHIYCTNRPGDVRPGTLGTAVEGYELRLLPEDAEGPGAPEVADGDTGVLWVRGPSAAIGYFEDRPKSFATFFGAWCRTGDLFRRDASGAFVFAGRADDLLKVSGIWVAPLEVEDCLVQHDAVSMAAVIGADDDGLVKVKAFVVLRDDVRSGDPAALAALADELRDFVKARLSKHKYPRFIVFEGDLPKNDRGKVDRRLLKEREARGENPRGH